MSFSFSGFIYRGLIDPLLSGLRDGIDDIITPGERVIDIACGTGALALALARKAGAVTGIDLSEVLVDLAARSARREGMANARFEARDAADLSGYADREFDAAVIAMAVHQFEKELAVHILEEMKRIAARVVVADYSAPLPANLAGSLARGIERFAGGDHYRNFREYMRLGGIAHFAGRAGLTVRSEAVRGSGVFMITEC